MTISVKFYSQKRKNYTLADLVIYGKQCLDYLIYDHLDPKDGTKHRIHLTVSAEIIQSQLKEIYKIFESINDIQIFQQRLA